MNIADLLDGATRLVVIIGDPIAQVKSPAGVTQSLIDRDRNAIAVPIHVTSADLERFIQGASLARNLDGIIVTVPHKFDVFRLCATATERAQFLGAVNVLAERTTAAGTAITRMVSASSKESARRGVARRVGARCWPAPAVRAPRSRSRCSKQVSSSSRSMTGIRSGATH